MSRDLLRRWFGDKRMQTVLGMVEEHLKLTQNAVRELFNMVNAASEGIEERKAALYKEVSDMEMRADSLRRDMVEELTKREVYPTEREDLMELVRAVDWVADWSREAGRILSIIPFERAPDDMKKAAQDMCKANNDCVTSLANCLKALPENPSKALDLANEVEMMEEDIDELYSIARRCLAALNFEGFTTGSLILLNMFLDAVETVADWCENTADIVRAIAVRIY